ncbi:class I SAM-dependent methyltransferase [Cryomorphaceae bacterium 1068]|nr:class I SAM-dependent methyltransferase [Cryomorphaceae bacterium 1068]
MSLYDRIGINYSDLRKPDPRIEATIWKEIGDAKTILNIGAGAGSYEPPQRNLTAVEPSATMIAQRPEGAAPVVQASAEDLPFGLNEFDLSMAMLTLHHWKDMAKGLEEMKRVSRRQLLLTWDPHHAGCWLAQDYFPEILAIDRAIFPSFEEIEKHLGPMKRIPVPIPHDCTDGFAYAYWRRPEAYLLPEVRQAISTFTKIKETESGLSKLREDLESGNWEKRYGFLKNRDALDSGYAVLVS